MGNYSLVKGIPERLKEESTRINNHQKEKYKNDEEYRNSQKVKAKMYRDAKKNKLVD